VAYDRVSLSRPSTNVKFSCGRWVCDRQGGASSRRGQGHHVASRGYPRAVNNLAVAALIATYAADKSIVDLAAAQSAITENSECPHATADDHHVTIDGAQRNSPVLLIEAPQVAGLG
jgi:hypothetical protein